MIPASPWPQNAALEVITKTAFPEVVAAAADPATTFNPDLHCTGHGITLHVSEPVRLVRYLPSGRHIIAYHSSGVLFASSLTPFRRLTEA